jgi:hypothetical protein
VQWQADAQQGTFPLWISISFYVQMGRWLSTINNYYRLALCCLFHIKIPFNPHKPLRLDETGKLYYFNKFLKRQTQDIKTRK